MSSASTRVGWATDALCLEHATGYGHPERPERLRALLELAQDPAWEDRLLAIPGRDATRAEMLAAHTESHLATLEQLDAAGGGSIDPDTAMGEQSWAAARRAAGTGCAAVEAVLLGTTRRAFAAIRPPGHHATADQAMGFCLLNNAAIAARRAQALGARRVAVIDWDVHHGNGTQEIFWNDPDVFYGSVHQAPLYPGTGAALERGGGDAPDATRNLPVPAGSGDDVFLDAMRTFAADLDAFRPDLVIVSAGYDAAARDRLAQCEVTAAGFGAMARTVVAAAERLCAGRLVFVLEGGYHLASLRDGVAATLAALASAGIPGASCRLADEA